MGVPLGTRPRCRPGRGEPSYWTAVSCTTNRSHGRVRSQRGTPFKAAGRCAGRTLGKSQHDESINAPAKQILELPLSLESFKGLKVGEDNSNRQNVDIPKGASAWKWCLKIGWKRIRCVLYELQDIDFLGYIYKKLDTKSDDRRAKEPATEPVKGGEEEWDQDEPNRAGGPGIRVKMLSMQQNDGADVPERGSPTSASGTRSTWATRKCHVNYTCIVY